MSLPKPAALALSALLLAHLLAVADHAFADLSGGPLSPVASDLVRWAQLQQHWRMFRQPYKWDHFLLHEGLTADEEVLILRDDDRPPEGFYLRWDYSRDYKVRQKVLFERDPQESRRRAYARWLCRGAPEEVVAVRLVALNRRHPTPKELREAPDAPRQEKRRVIWEEPCE